MSPSRTSLTAGMLLLTGFFMATIACAGLFTAMPTRTPTVAPPTATVSPTETAVPLYKQVVLQSATWQDDAQPSGYTITAQMPVLVGSDDARVKGFNADMKAIVDNAVAEFKQNLAGLPATPDSVASTFDMRYNLMSPFGNLLSIKFDTQIYYAGAAHPGDFSTTVTYDLDAGHELSLADLFLPDVDFLSVLAKYCTTQLSTRDIGFQGFELGATATAQNYRNWNLTADGLMISFDEYQVAPYAAGPQTVVIPYKQLAAIMQPGGPLASFINGVNQ